MNMTLLCRSYYQTQKKPQEHDLNQLLRPSERVFNNVIRLCGKRPPSNQTPVFIYSVLLGLVWKKAQIPVKEENGYSKILGIPVSPPYSFEFLD